MKNSTVKGYKIKFAERKIVMNCKFASAAEVYGSPEYKMLKAIREDFPTFDVIIQKGREIKTPRKTKRMKYKNMEKYINTFENAEELMEMYELAKAKSVIIKSPYKYVLDWFKLQFPNYKEIPEMYESHDKVTPLPTPNVEDYEKKDEKAS